MAHAGNAAQILAFIQQHPHLSSIVGTTVTLKSLELWVNNGAPLPGYGNLFIGSSYHGLSQNVPKSLPSPTVPNFNIIDHRDLVTHAVASNLTQLGGLGQHLVHLESADASFPSLLFNASKTVTGPSSPDTHIVGLMCALVAAVGLVTIIARCKKAVKEREDNDDSVSDKQLIDWLTQEWRTLITQNRTLRDDLAKSETRYKVLEDALKAAQHSLLDAEETAEQSDRACDAVWVSFAKACGERDVQCRNNHTIFARMAAMKGQHRIDVAAIRAELYDIIDDKTREILNLDTINCNLERECKDLLQVRRKLGQDNATLTQQCLTSTQQNQTLLQRNTVLVQQHTDLEKQVTDLELEIEQHISAAYSETEDQEYYWDVAKLAAEAREQWHCTDRAVALANKDVIISDLEADNQTLRRDIEAARAQLKTTTDEAQEKKRKLEEAENQQHINALRKAAEHSAKRLLDLETTKDGEIETLREESAGLTEKLRQSEETVVARDRIISGLKRQNEVLEEKKGAIARTATHNSDKVKRLVAEKEDLAGRLEAAEKDLRDKDDNIGKLKKEMEELKSQLQISQANSQTQADELRGASEKEQRLHDELQKLQEDRNAVEEEHLSEIRKMEEDHATNVENEKLKVMKRGKESVEKLCEAHSAELEKLRSDTTGQIEKANATLSEREAQFDELSEKLKRDAEELDAQKSIASDQGKQIKKLELEQSELHTNIAELREEKEQADQLVKDTREMLDQSQNNADDLQGQLVVAQEELGQANKMIEETRQSLGPIEATLQAVKQQHETLRSGHDQAKMEVAAMEVLEASTSKKIAEQLSEIKELCRQRDQVVDDAAAVANELLNQMQRDEAGVCQGLEKVSNELKRSQTTLRELRIQHGLQLAMKLDEINAKVQELEEKDQIIKTLIDQQEISEQLYKGTNDELEEKTREILKLQAREDDERNRSTETIKQHLELIDQVHDDLEAADNKLKGSQQLQDEQKILLMQKENEIITKDRKIEVRDRHFETVKERQEQVEQSYQADFEEEERQHAAILQQQQQSEHSLKAKIKELEEKLRDAEFKADDTSNEATAISTLEPSSDKKGQADRVVITAKLNWSSRTCKHDWQWAVRVGIAQRGPYSDSKLIRLQLPHADPFYSDLPKPIPKPCDESFMGEKFTCDKCHQAYEKDDFHMHSHLCATFFSDHAAICEHCNYVFVSNGTFNAHLKACPWLPAAAPAVVAALPLYSEFDVIGANISQLSAEPDAEKVMDLKLANMDDTLRDLLLNAVVRAVFPHADPDYAPCNLPKPSLQQYSLDPGKVPGPEFSWAGKIRCCNCKEWYTKDVFFKHKPACTSFFQGTGEFAPHVRCNHCGDCFRKNDAFKRHEELCSQQPTAAACEFCGDITKLAGGAHEEHVMQCHLNPKQIMRPTKQPVKPSVHGSQTSEASQASETLRTPGATSVSVDKGSVKGAASSAGHTACRSPAPPSSGKKTCSHCSNPFTGDIGEHFKHCHIKQQKLVALNKTPEQQQLRLQENLQVQRGINGPFSNHATPTHPPGFNGGMGWPTHPNNYNHAAPPYPQNWSPAAIGNAPTNAPMTGFGMSPHAQPYTPYGHNRQNSRGVHSTSSISAGFSPNPIFDPPPRPIFTGGPQLSYSPNPQHRFTPPPPRPQYPPPNGSHGPAPMPPNQGPGDMNNENSEGGGSGPV